METSVCRLCGNKHKQYQDRGRTRCGSCNTKVRRVRNSLAAIAYLGGKCLDCGETHPACLEFHHRNPGDKEFTIGSAANKSWEVLQPELDKCDLLCSNCHQKRHTLKYSLDFINEAETYAGDKAVFDLIDWSYWKGILAETVQAPG